MTELLRIDRTIEIEASPERVWRALTNPAELAIWIEVTMEGEFSPGNEVWMTSTNPQFAGMRWPVRIVEMMPPRRLVWLWHPGQIDSAVDYSKEPMTTVTFTVEPSGQGTRLTVSETGFDELSLERRAAALMANTEGWTEVLASLQRHVEKAH
jgi:uncharacterized protein YndB with AHSA1/START domain